MRKIERELSNRLAALCIRDAATLAREGKIEQNEIEAVAAVQMEKIADWIYDLWREGFINA